MKRYFCGISAGWIECIFLYFARTAVISAILAVVSVFAVIVQPVSGVALQQPVAVAQSISGGGSGAYIAVLPFRVADTRSGSGCANMSPEGSLGPHATAALTVRGAVACEGTSGSVPPDAVAAVLNVTVADPADGGFLTLYPEGTARSITSTLNWAAGETISNSSTVVLGTSGAINIYNGSAGDTNVVVDIEGYYAPAGSSNGSGHYQAMSPYRVCDTRPTAISGLTDQCTGKALGPGATLVVNVAGSGSVPLTGTAAVALNVTVVNPSSAGYITLYPDGFARPATSDMNFAAHDVIADQVTVEVGTKGSIEVYNSSGTTNIVVDVTGYFFNSTMSSTAGSLYSPVTPYRICDTRPTATSGLTDQCTGHTLQAGTSSQVITLQVAGNGGIPPSTSVTPPVAVVMNVTVTGTTNSSYLTVYPAASSSVSPPVSSNVNWTNGMTIANQVIATVAPGGTIDLYNFSGSANVVVDVLGYYTAASATWTEALPAVPYGSPSVVENAQNGSGQSHQSIEYASTAYDAASGQVILFGGEGNDSGNTFIWNGSAWSMESTVNGPLPRYGAAMAYDASNQTVVMFGGRIPCSACTSGYALSGSTWVWSGNSWSKVAATSGPSPQYGASMAYDQAMGKIVLYTAYGNTWTWDGSKWTELSPTASPGAVCGAAMAYDASNQTVVMFGGYNNSLVLSSLGIGCAGAYGQAGASLNSTWSFNGTTWQQLSPLDSPPGRYNGAMTYDPSTGQLVLFGGDTGSIDSETPLNDTWTWNGTNWTEQQPQSSPPDGDGTNGMAWDSATIVMLGDSGATWQYPTY